MRVESSGEVLRIGGEMAMCLKSGEMSCLTPGSWCFPTPHPTRAPERRFVHKQRA